MKTATAAPVSSRQKLSKTGSHTLRKINKYKTYYLLLILPMAYFIIFIVDGRQVLEDGRMPGVDLPQLRARAQEGFDRFKSSYTHFDLSHRPGDVLFPPAFPLR